MNLESPGEGEQGREGVQGPQVLSPALRLWFRAPSVIMWTVSFSSIK